MLSAQEREAAADALREAERSRSAIVPLIETWPDIDVADAYRIQLANIDLRLAGGATVVGHKVGLSSKAMQQMMGVDEPDYGHLLSDMACDEQTPVDAGRFLIPRVEPESLRGGNAETNADVARRLLAGEQGAVRDAVLLNAAAAIAAARAGDANLVDRLADGLEVARQALDSGAAADALDRWRAVSLQSRG